MRRAMVLVMACVVTHAAAPVRAQPAGGPALRPGASHAVPLYGALLRVYDAPDDPYAAGHRGVDVGAAAGSAVRASAPGTVSFAGSVAGNRTVSVDHPDGVRTTYSYLASALVRAGDAVERGRAVGTVGAGHPGSGLGPHVHLSARRGGVYFDPLELYVGSGYADLLSLTA